MPGVKAVGAISRLPVTGSFHSWGAQHADQPADSRFTPAQQRVVEGRYFDAVGIPLLQGRAFGVEDSAKAPRRVVVSEELVRQMFPSEDPIGMRLRVAGAQPEIIGVVGDVALGPRALPRPYVYHSHSQFAADRNWSLTQVVALDRDPQLFLRDARRELSHIDRELVLYEPQMLENVVGGGVAQERFALLLIASFAALALVLAAVGVRRPQLPGESAQPGDRNSARARRDAAIRPIDDRSRWRTACRHRCRRRMRRGTRGDQVAAIAAVRDQRDRAARVRRRSRIARECRGDGKLDSRARRDQGRSARRRA